MMQNWYIGGMQAVPAGMPPLPPRAGSLPPSPMLPPLYPTQSLASGIPAVTSFGRPPSLQVQVPPPIGFSGAVGGRSGSSSQPSSFSMYKDAMASPRPDRFPSRDINLMSPSTIVQPHTPIPPSPGRFSSVPQSPGRFQAVPSSPGRVPSVPPSPGRPTSVQAAMKKYVCDYGCGFMGGFEEVTLHERICDRAPRPPTMPSTPQVQPETPMTPITPVGAVRFSCDYGCGFVGSFKSVEDHERTCKYALPPGGLSSVGEPNERKYKCDWGCGFEGSFQAVEMHEKACNQRPGAPAPGSTAKPPAGSAKDLPVASPPAPGTEKDVFYCQNLCGFKGNFMQVEEHERGCTKAPTTDV